MYKIHIIVNNLIAHTDYPSTLEVAMIRLESLRKTTLGKMGEVILVREETNERVA